MVKYLYQMKANPNFTDKVQDILDLNLFLNYLLDVYLLKEFIKIYENWSIFADGSRACPHRG